ncbi:PREDICTED: matrix extracellular phosphoglycoprotein isoform X2 [Propithecus coquereli]|uniref:Matrix extracellular phosphoglycoprotein n=1 Tax=Propithecus coquereli TaxID=379532 RepID=A0A2K6H032_PROCO|nr:PREDICTED: matrix extracellular phosphoglycoprotein isoform X2 [Propithecus coquereli]
MQVVCVGLLLFSVIWAAPTFQPQTEKTKQGCVEEQRQEEKDNVALRHLDERRHQEPAPKENVVQEREKNVSLSEASENNQSSKSPNPFANRQTPNEDYSISNKENVHNDLKMSVYAESPGNTGADDGDDAISKLHDQEEYSAALIRKNLQHIMGPVTAIKLLGEENKKNKPRNVLNKIPAGANYAKARSKDRKNPQRDSQAQKSPTKIKGSHYTQDTANYLKHLSKVKKIPSDFEGSGYEDLQERGDNDVSSFSGDGQPFEDIPGKGGAVGPDLEGMDIQTGVSGPAEAETVTPDTRGPGYNEIPEREENGDYAFGTRGETAKEPDAVDISLVEGSNDITGSTNFQELPGREGNRVDAGSQNAQQGKVELHYPHPPSKEKRKEGSGHAAGSTNYNEIPKNGKGSTRKGTEHSNRNQGTVNEEQRYSSKGKSRGPLLPSRGLDNEFQNEIGSHYGPNNERDTTHSRKYHYVPHGQNNSVRNNGIPQRKGSRGHRGPHSHRRFSSPRREDSSESSDSGSSSESDGD